MCGSQMLWGPGAIAIHRFQRRMTSLKLRVYWFLLETYIFHLEKS